MTDKQYLNESILQLLLKKLDELTQQSEEPKSINLDLLLCLVEQAQMQA